MNESQDFREITYMYKQGYQALLSQLWGLAWSEAIASHRITELSPEWFLLDPLTTKSVLHAGIFQILENVILGV